MGKEKAYEYKKMKNGGAIYHLIKYAGESNYKIHSWDGPAIIPQSKDCTVSKAWYINGIEYDQESYDERIREREGLPPSKQSGNEEIRV